MCSLQVLQETNTGEARQIEAFSYGKVHENHVGLNHGSGTEAASCITHPSSAPVTRDTTPNAETVKKTKGTEKLSIGAVGDPPVLRAEWL